MLHPLIARTSYNLKLRFLTQITCCISSCTHIFMRESLEGGIMIIKDYILPLYSMCFIHNTCIAIFKVLKIWQFRQFLTVLDSYENRIVLSNHANRALMYRTIHLSFWIAIFAFLNWTITNYS